MARERRWAGQPGRRVSGLLQEGEEDSGCTQALNEASLTPRAWLLQFLLQISVWTIVAMGFVTLRLSETNMLILKITK